MRRILIALALLTITACSSSEARWAVEAQAQRMGYSHIVWHSMEPGQSLDKDRQVWNSDLEIDGRRVQLTWIAFRTPAGLQMVPVK
jgi:hypothetical protein